MEVIVLRAGKFINLADGFCLPAFRYAAEDGLPQFSIVSLLIQGVVSPWMDVCSIYLCPIGAALAGIMFFWLCGKDFVREQMNKGRAKPLAEAFYPLAKYGYCVVALVVLIAGSLLGGIG